MTDLYEGNLWGKIDYLHERYQREHNHISNFLSMMAQYQNACLDFSKQITNILNKNYILSESNTSSLYKSMENYYKCLLIHSKAFKDTFESIKINMTPVTKSISDSFQKEKEMYNFYIKTRNVYNNNLSNLEKIKKDFSQKARECENLVYEAKKAKIFRTSPPEQISKMENKASEYIANTALYEDKYIQILKEANKSRENEINTQKKLQNYYHNIDVDYYGKIKMMTGFFISCLKRMFNTISVDIDEFNETFNKINIEKDINDFIEKNKTSTKPDSIIKFIPFKPAPEITSNSITNTIGYEKKHLVVSYEVIIVFQKLFKFIRTDLNMEEEKKKNRLRIITSKIFIPRDNISLSQNDIDELFSLFKQKKYRTFFIDILSKNRNKAKKNERLKSDLVEIFLKLLEYAEKEKDLELALNCITLCQTFYYEKLNKYKNQNDKKYLIEEIKENKWLNTTEFWEAIINLMIQKEVVNNEEIRNNNEKEKKNAFNKIVYTQILNYSTIMVEFNINKDDIITLVQNISEKYQLKKENCDLIIKTIIKDKKSDALKEIDKKIEEKKNEIKEKEVKEEKNEKENEKEDEKEKIEEKNEIIDNKENEKKEDKKEEINENKNDENEDEDDNVEEEKVKSEKKEEKEEKDEKDEKEEKDENKDKDKEKEEKEEKSNKNENEEEIISEEKKVSEEKDN